MTKHLNFKLVVVSISLFCLLMSCKNLSKDPNEIVKRAKSTEYIVEYLDCCIKLKNQLLICNLVMTTDKWYKRRAALDFLTNETLLKRVADESDDKMVSSAARNRLEKVERGIALETIFTSFQIGSRGEIKVESNSTIKGAKEFRKATFKEAIVMVVP
jgi:hypothetical protein